MRTRDSQDGFTAIEVLIGMTVAMIVLAGVMSLYVTTARGNAVAYQQAIATSVARASIEELRGESIDAIITEYGALPIDDEAMDVTEIHNVDYAPYLSVTEVAGDASLVVVRVEVDWTERGAAPGDPLTDHQIRVEVIRNKIDNL